MSSTGLLTRLAEPHRGDFIAVAVAQNYPWKTVLSAILAIPLLWRTFGAPPPPGQYKDAGANLVVSLAIVGGGAARRRHQIRSRKTETGVKNHA